MPYYAENIVVGSINLTLAVLCPIQWLERTSWRVNCQFSRSCGAQKVGAPQGEENEYTLIPVSEHGCGVGKVERGRSRCPRSLNCPLSCNLAVTTGFSPQQ